MANLNSCATASIRAFSPSVPKHRRYSSSLCVKQSKKMQRTKKMKSFSIVDQHQPKKYECISFLFVTSNKCTRAPAANVARTIIAAYERSQAKYQ